MQQNPRYGNRITNEEFKYGLCECNLEGSRCCYVWCCGSCAMADLSLVQDDCCIENPMLRWWLTAGSCFLSYVCFWLQTQLHYVLGSEGRALGQILLWGSWACMMYLSFNLFNISTTIARKIGYAEEECSCGTCCTYMWCFLCKTCQIANQLDWDQNGVQSRETVELVTKINEKTLIKNVLCRIRPQANPVPQQRQNYPAPAPMYASRQQNYGAPQPNYAVQQPNYAAPVAVVQRAPRESPLYVAPNARNPSAPQNQFQAEGNASQPKAPFAPQNQFQGEGGQTGTGTGRIQV